MAEREQTRTLSCAKTRRIRENSKGFPRKKISVCLSKLKIACFLFHLLLLEHPAHAAQIVRWRDAERELEGLVERCSIAEAALAGNIGHRTVGVLHEYLCGVFGPQRVDVVERTGGIGIARHQLAERLATDSHKLNQRILVEVRVGKGASPC